VQTAGLLVVGVAVLLLPVTVRKVGQELEVFLLLMGAAAVTIASRWSLGLAEDAAVQALPITVAALAGGVVFHFLRPLLWKGIERVRIVTGARIMAAGLVIAVGILSSFITAIIAALVLVEVVSSMHLPRKTEIRLVVLACFSIGMGSALTPTGGPLAAIAVAKLAGEPYHAGFWFLMERLWMFVVPGIALVGAGAVLVTRPLPGAEETEDVKQPERLADAFLRAAKVFLFVFGLVLLGAGFTPLIEHAVGLVSPLALFWANSASAVLDNATLAAAEVVPSLQGRQVLAAMLGLVIAGGMLVPGNIPNIISAGRLKIDARSWAVFGLPVGAALMSICFAALVIIG
jgi:predicted cation transporter